MDSYLAYPGLGSSDLKQGGNKSAAVYEMLDRDAKDRALRTDEATCPRGCGVWIIANDEFKYCPACGWHQEYDRPDHHRPDSGERRGYVDYEYSGADEHYKDAVLQGVITHRAGGYSRTVYRCPDFTNLNSALRCSLDMKRLDRTRAGWIFFGCAKGHRVVLGIGAADWRFPWEIVK